MSVTVKTKIKSTGADARRIASVLHGGATPDASGSNYVSPNKLYVPSGASSGQRGASERVPYKSVPGATAGSTPTEPVIGNSSSQVNGPEGFGPSCTDGIDTVKAVTRTQNPVEAARQKNNRTRDMRTNLGRGKQSQPTV